MALKTNWVDRGPGDPATSDNTQSAASKNAEAVEVNATTTTATAAAASAGTANTAAGNAAAAAAAAQSTANGKYTKPGSGIPKADLDTANQTSLGKADTAYQKPGSGIPKTDLVAAVQTSLGKADTALQSVTSANISDLPEAVQDIVAGFFAAGSNITLNYNDAGNTLTISGEAGGGGGTSDPEVVRDTIGVALSGLGNITVTVNDAADTIVITTTATVNSTDAFLLDRANHSGTQPVSSLAGVTADANELNALDGIPATLTATELGYMDGVTGPVQGQLDGKQGKFLTGTVATAASTAAKTVTLDAPWASYTPVAGDVLALTYTNGTTPSAVTLAVNGGAARNVRLGNANANASHHFTGAGGSLLYRFDGTYFHALGSQANTAFDAAATASTVILRDGNANAFADNFVSSTAQITLGSTSGANTLTQNDTQVQRYVGTADHATTLWAANPGWTYVFIHAGTAGTLTVKASGGGTITTLTAGDTLVVEPNTATATTPAMWATLAGSVLVKGKQDKFTGTPDGTKFAADDGTFKTPPSSGGSSDPAPYTAILPAITANSTVTIPHSMNTLNLLPPLLFRTYALNGQTAREIVNVTKWGITDFNNAYIEFVDAWAANTLSIIWNGKAMPAAWDSVVPGAATLTQGTVTQTTVPLTISHGVDAGVGTAFTNLYRNNTGTGTPLAVIPVGTTTYTDAGLTSSTLYQYSARSVDLNGNVSTTLSNVISATTSAGIVVPTFDSYAEGAVGNNQSVANQTWTHGTVGGNPATNLGIIAVPCSNGGAQNGVPGGTPTATLGGVSLPFLGYKLMGDNAPQAGFIAVFAGLGVPAGTPLTAAINMSTAGGVFANALPVSFVYQGVGSIGTLVSSNAISAAPSVTVASATGRRVWGMFANYQVNSYSAPTFTVRRGQTATAPGYTSGDMAAAASTVFAATQSASLHWAGVGFQMLPV